MTDAAIDRPGGSQEPVIAFLGEKTNYPTVPERVDIIETHGAFVFLAGGEVFKIKRAVTYDYMDCSTLQAREELCRREFAINQPVAPQIYRGVVAITREADGTLAFDGAGPPVEWAVHMSRFDEACVLENMANRGALSNAIAADLGEAVARLHHNAESVDPESGHALVLEIIDELARVFPKFEDILGKRECETFDTVCRRELARHRDLLDERGNEGYVRRCHGDLHLRNIVHLDGKIVPFDALEFDDRLATTDILYDLAFLLMDLLHRGLTGQANVVFNRYFACPRADSSLDALALLPLFMGLRAGIRAMVSVQTADQDRANAARLHEEGRRYLRRALMFLDRPGPCLIAVGGLSGTGKSVLAASLAPSIGAAPGALVLRSDVERKHMFNVDELTQLDGQHYGETISAKIYQRLREKARTALEAGHSVILDAVHQDAAERDAAASLARQAGVGFLGLWLEAGLETMIERVGARKSDASDADARVVIQQVKRNTGPMDWMEIDANGTPEETLERAKHSLAQADMLPGKVDRVN